MIDAYTRLLERVADHADEATAEKAVSKLIAHLKSTGRAKMLPSLHKELHKIALRRQALAPRLEVANQKHRDTSLAEAKALGLTIEKTIVNPALISGWRALSHGTLVDRSGKNALLQLYRRITS